MQYIMVLCDTGCENDRWGEEMQFSLVDRTNEVLVHRFSLVDRTNEVLVHRFSLVDRTNEVLVHRFSQFMWYLLIISSSCQ
jgi:hypothetical protein